MKDFIELIKENAVYYPQRIAVIDGDRKINYLDFLNLVNSISHNLILLNNKPKVVFDLNQSIEAYALILAILNVGGIYCPLNHDAPLARKIQIIDEFDPNIIVLESEEKISGVDLKKVITVDKLIAINNGLKLDISYQDDDIIYVIYTSGSTGMPKGVKICRKALNKFLEWSIPTYSAKEGDVWGQFSLLNFDLSIVDIFTCLCSGATLFAMNDVIARKYRPSGEIEKGRITIWHSIPSAVEFMIKNEISKIYDFSSLRLMSFCGETLYKHHVEFLFGKKSDLTIFNTYGPTEGTLFCTWQELKKSNYHEYCQNSMSIGNAIPGWNIRLISNEEFEGNEVVIHGDYIGKGYLGNVTDSKYKTIGVNGKKTESFETGDIVNKVGNNLFFSCRKDRQVKIKGYRVELDEIDLRIREFINKPCVTVVKKETLYSFIETNENINEQELREYLKIKIEEFKIPNGFYAISEIPRGQNQKVDISELIKRLS